MYDDARTVMTDGNHVVADPGFDVGGTTDVGAVHLYDGTDDTNRLTSNDALPVPTTRGRVLLMQLDRSP